MRFNFANNLATKIALASTLALGLGSSALAAPSMSQNMDFEVDGQAGVPPSGWFQVGSGYSAYTISGGVNGRFGVGIAVAQPSHTFGGVGQCIPAAYFHDKHIMLQGWISTWMVEDGYAGLWLRVDGPQGRVISLDNMSNRPIEGTTNWHRYMVIAAVPEEATEICYGVINTGFGTAFADLLTLGIWAE